MELLEAQVDRLGVAHLEKLLTLNIDRKLITHHALINALKT